MWAVEFAEAAERDFELIFDYLLKSYQEFGDDFDTAFDRAEQRIGAIHTSARDLAKIPFQGTLCPDILPNLRFVRRNKAVFWFVAKKDQEIVQILAVFFGSQDHTRHMLARLLSGLPE